MPNKPDAKLQTPQSTSDQPPYKSSNWENQLQPTEQTTKQTQENTADQRNVHPYPKIMIMRNLHQPIVLSGSIIIKYDYQICYLFAFSLFALLSTIIFVVVDIIICNRHCSADNIHTSAFILWYLIISDDVSSI